MAPKKISKPKKISEIVTNLLNGKTYKDLIGKNHSENGLIFESIYKILAIDKNVTSINILYSEIYNCQMGDVKNSQNISNIKKFYDTNVYNASSGKSDFTTKYKICYTFTSCKYKKDFTPGESDIERLNNEASHNLKLDETKYKLSFVCKDKSKVENHRHTHKPLKNYFKKIIENNLLFDLNDIKNGIDEFHRLHKYKSYKEYCDYINIECLGNSRETLQKRLHQQMTLMKFIKNFEKKKEKKHLISHKTRTGKSITQLLIIKWLIENKKKVLFMTSVPSTIKYFINDLEKYVTFKNIEYVKLDGNIDGNIDEICINNNSLTLCSIQFLKNDINGYKKMFLIKQKYDVILIDECHYGSSTKKTKCNIIDIDANTNEIIGSSKVSIFSSGTSKKTQQFYKIKDNYVYKWELYDESQMKLLHEDNYENEEIIDNMTLRHGDEFKKVISDQNLNKDYTNMPIQMLMKAKIPEDLVEKIKKYNSDNRENIGFSSKSILSSESNNEINENGRYIKIYLPKLELEKTTDGESILENYLDNIISNDKNKNTVMKRIEKAQFKHDSRKSTKESPKLFIIYLPTHTGNSSIDMLQQALKNFINRKKLWSNYHIVSANSKENMGDYKKEYNEEIECAMKETKEKEKIGCILLIGDKGTTGITYDDCDVSIHLDDGHNLETQIQKRARPGTPAKDKTIFINVDMNIHRSLYTLSDVIKQYKVGKKKKDLSNKDILIYLHKNKLFLWDDDDFNNGEMIPKELDSYFQKLSEKLCNEIDYVQIMNELCDNINCDDELKEYIDGNIIVKKYTEVINSDLDGEQKDVPKGHLTKIEIDRIKKVQLDNLKEGDVKGKEEIEENIKETINKTVELAKSKRGLPFLGLLLRVTINNAESIKNLLETETDLIKEVLKPIISKIDKIYIYDIYKTIMSNIIDKHQDIVNQIVEIYNNTPSDKLRDIIASHFIASAEEEIKNAEIPTPPSLCDNMLKQIPETFWTSIQKVGELCCGKGNFVLAIFDKFYEGLKTTYPDNFERCKIISTKCLYFTDINPLDIFITKSILKCHIQSYCGKCEINYKFNCDVLDTLKTDIKNKFNIKGFNAIIGNPPYNSPGKTGTGNTIWQFFTKKSIDEWLVNGGYLLYVHPPGWRKPNTTKSKFVGMYKKMAIDNQLIYIEMHNAKDGKKVFNKGTRYDFYLLQKIKRNCKTKINDIDNNKYELNLSKLEWLPNSNIIDIMKILNNDTDTTNKCPVIYNRSNYGSDKDYTSETKTDIYKYPLVHSTNKKGIRYRYSNCNNKGHFGISKVIFGQAGINDVIVDLKGEYGMTEHAIAIEVINMNEANNLKIALLSNKFNEILKSTMYSNFMIDWRIFQNFKKDWWKEYINVESTQLTNLVSNTNNNLNNDNDNDNDINKTTLSKKTVVQLKKYIKDNKLKIKINQKKDDLVKAIINSLTNN
jgi:hypothetical protein